MKSFVKDKAGIYVSGESYKVNYPDEYRQISTDYDEESFWFKHRNRVISEVMKKLKPAGNFVDIGGGNGLQAAFIQKEYPNKDIAMIEPGYQGCLTAAKRGVKYVYNSLFQDFDFKGFNTSMVGLFDVVEHIEDDARFLRELSAKLQTGNIILMTVPAYNFLWSELDHYAVHCRRYNKRMVHELAGKSGLKIRYFSNFFSYLIPLTLFFRTIPYKIRGKRSDDKIIAMESKHHKANYLVNKLFSSLSILEMFFIRKSSCAFGTSIIVAFEIP